MTSDVKGKMEKILVGQLKYTSSNLGFNMLVTRLQRKAMADPTPGTVSDCMKEIEEFASKYQAIMEPEFAKIAAL